MQSISFYSLSFLPTLNSFLPLCTRSTNQVASKWDLFLPIWQAPSPLCQAACIGRLFFLAAMGIGWLALNSTCWMAGQCLPLPALLPPQPFRVMAQSASLLSGIIVLARGENTWRWNCFSVKVFCSNMEVPGQNLQVPSPELDRRRECWRWQPSKMAKKEDHFGVGQPKPIYASTSCATVENCPMILGLSFLMCKMKGLVF